MNKAKTVNAKQQQNPESHWLQHQIEQAKREWEVTVDSLPQLICLLDQQQRVLRTNRTIEAWGIAEVVAVKGKPLVDLLHPQHPESYLADFLAQAWPQLMAGESASLEIEDTLLGRHLYIQLLPIQQFDSELPTVTDKDETFASLVMEDITARKQIEAVLAQARQTLEIRVTERTHGLSMLYNASQALTSTLDLQTVLQQMMDEVRNLFDAEGASILLYQPDNNMLNFAAVSNRAITQQTFEAMPADKGIAGRAFREKRAIVVSNVQQDMEFYPQIDQVTGLTTQALLAMPIIYKEQAIGVVEVINPRTGQYNPQQVHLLESLARSAAIAIENARLFEAERQQSRRLQESQQQLIQVEKMAALGRLMASVTHEINNPIQSILGYLMLAQELVSEQAVDEDLALFIDTAVREAKRIADLGTRLRRFYRPAIHSETRLDTGDSVESFFDSMQAELAPINIHHTIEEVLYLVNKQLIKNNIIVEQTWAADLPFVRGNAAYLTQVFLNLILNAADAMSDSGGQLSIRTQLHETHAPATVEITFSDTGTGIPPETLARIFEPLFTTKQNGTGIGLFTSYKIIEAHQGNISVSSEVDMGTTVSVTLPVA